VAWFKHESDLDGSPIAERSITWNLWQQRLLPFHRVAAGDSIYLVSRGAPATSQVVAEVKVCGVVAERYASKEQAWKLLRTGLREWVQASRLTRAEFLGHWYTLQAPEEGWLLAVAREWIRDIDQPRPEGLRFPRHGWLEAEERVVLG
jgi:hypothetical protein